MSYILDALRRADAERERGQVPGIHAKPGWSAPTATGGVDSRPAGRRRDALVIGVVLLFAIVAGLSWRGFGPERASAPASEGGAAVQAPAVWPSPAATAAPALRSAPGATVAVPEAARPDRPAAVPSTEMAVARPARKAAAGTTTAAASSTAATRQPAPTTLTTAATAATAATASSQAAPPGRPASAAARVYAVEELPEDIRRDLPRLMFGGSIYSESATSRFVIVNGQLFHEGDTLAPGLVLQQIRLKSAVLAFRGYRYGISY